MADNDIKLYSFSKIDAAFDAVAAEDDLPAVDVIAKMKDKILAHLNSGRSIAWVVSVLQRSGLDLGPRQIRTYLARTGIDGDTTKRAHGGTKQRTTRKPKATDGAQAQEGAVQTANAGAGSHAGNTSADARADSVQTSCSVRESSRAQDVQSAGNGFGDVPTEDVKPAVAEAVQDAGQDGDVPVPTGMDAVPAEDMQAVSADAGGAPTLQTHRSRKTGGRSFGADASGVLANGVQHGIIGFGQPDDDDLL